MLGIDDLKSRVDLLWDRINKTNTEYAKESSVKWYEISGSEAYCARIAKISDESQRKIDRYVKEIDELQKQIKLLNDSEWTKD